MRRAPSSLVQTSHIHAWTHVKPRAVASPSACMREYHDVVIDQRQVLGDLLDFLDQLDLASSDNTSLKQHLTHRPTMNTCRCGTTPFRNRKPRLEAPTTHSPDGPLPRQESPPARNRTKNSSTHLDWFPTSWRRTSRPTQESSEATRSSTTTYNCPRRATTWCLTYTAEARPAPCFIYFKPTTVAWRRCARQLEDAVMSSDHGTFTLWKGAFRVLRVP